MKKPKESADRSVGSVVSVVGDEAYGFRVREIRELPDGLGRMWRMEYAANGADLVWIETPDRVKTFAVAFMTLPEDDSGVAHIVEHSVLCGSEKFPVKEPFIELNKSSVAAFLNAWTQHDATVYPASSCNDQDLLNVAEVYLDAVFAPLSVKNGWAMPQERTVVFNEMKGAMSSPADIADLELNRMLFPSNVFGRNCGGDPAVIPLLTMQNYRNFYERFYHASNARIFLHGKVDIMPMLELVGSYLGRYQRRETPALPPVQLPVSAAETIEYPSKDITDRTRLCERWSFGTLRDYEKVCAMDLVCHVLAGSNESPVTKALLDAGVCERFSMSCSSGFQNTVKATFVNVKDGRLDDARRIFRETLERQLREGLDRKRIASLIEKREFDSREGCDDPFAPIGISVLKDILGGWLYGNDPAWAVGFSERYERLRRLNGTGHYERLAQETIVGNPHHAVLALKPVSKVNTSSVQPPAPADPAPEDTPENLAKIPKLRLSDIPEKGQFTECKVSSINGVEVVSPQIDTRGISYVDLHFDVDGLADAELLDLPLLAKALSNVPAGGYDVLGLKDEINSRLGKLHGLVATSRRGGDFSVVTSFLHSHADDALRLLRTVLFSSDFARRDLTGTLRRQKEIAFENELLESGYGKARIHASRGRSERNRIDELFSGLSQYRHLKNGTCGDLQTLAKKVFVRDRLSLTVTNPPSDDFAATLVGMAPSCCRVNRDMMDCRHSATAAASDAFATKGKGAFTAMCAKLPDGIAYSGAFAVAENILSLDFLWNKIRVKGGAYGGRISIDYRGDINLSSWRDPRPDATLETFKKCGDALREFVKSGASFENLQIAAAGSGEPNLHPAVEAILADIKYRDGITTEAQQRIRSEILHTTPEDLLRVADILDQILPTATRCVIGEEDLVKSCGLSEFDMGGNHNNS